MEDEQSESVPVETYLTRAQGIRIIQLSGQIGTDASEDVLHVCLAASSASENPGVVAPRGNAVAGNPRNIIARAMAATPIFTQSGARASNRASTHAVSNAMDAVVPQRSRCICQPNLMELFCNTASIQEATLRASMHKASHRWGERRKAMKPSTRTTRNRMGH